MVLQFLEIDATQHRGYRHSQVGLDLATSFTDCRMPIRDPESELYGKLVLADQRYVDCLKRNQLKIIAKQKLLESFVRASNAR